MSDPRMLPHWVIQLVADIEYHEDVHSKDGECVKEALDKVPSEIRHYAAGWGARARAAEVEHETRMSMAIPVAEAYGTEPR